MTKMGTSTVVQEALVDLDASFLIVFQKLIIIWTGAFDAPFGIRAQMRTTAVIFNTLVGIRTSLKIIFQLITLRTNAFDFRRARVELARMRTTGIIARIFTRKRVVG